MADRTRGWTRYASGVCVGVLAMLGGGAESVEAGSFLFEKIVDSNTAVPGGQEDFSGFGTMVVHGAEVAFGGSESVRADGSRNQGIYSTTGGGSGLVALVDLQTPVPGGEGRFGEFESRFTVNGSTVVFEAEVEEADPLVFGLFTNVGDGPLATVAGVGEEVTSVPGEPGQEFSDFRNFTVQGDSVLFLGVVGSFPLRLYRYSQEGGLVSIAGPGVAVPGGSGDFSQVSDYEVSGSNLAVSSPVTGVYRDTGSGLTPVADTGTSVPEGEGDFTAFGGVSISGTSVAFMGEDAAGHEGVYVQFAEGELMKVVDTRTPVPGGTGNFTDINAVEVSISGTGVGFVADDDTENIGYYAFTPEGGIVTVVDQNTTVPGGTGTFIDFTAPSIEGAAFSFAGQDEVGVWGVFSNVGGELEKVVGQGDVLGGKVLKGLLFETVLSGDDIVFMAIFEDDSRGIFRATLVPEPTVLVVLGIGALAFLGRRGRGYR